MKYVFIILIAVLLGIGSFLFLRQDTSTTATKPPAVNKEETAQENHTTNVDVPETIIIPSLNIKAPIESVGLDNENKMDVPKDPDNAGWYNLGYKPGELGSAVIAGHIDTPTGAPAIFYKLTSLKNGDTITIVDVEGNEHSFSVVDNKIFDFDKVPLQEVFASGGAKRLNLITCDGVFDKSSENYSKRRVIFAVAK